MARYSRTNAPLFLFDSVQTYLFHTMIIFSYILILPRKSGDFFCLTILRWATTFKIDLRLPLDLCENHGMAHGSFFWDPPIEVALEVGGIHQRDALRVVVMHVK